jgi:DNA-binding NtrC family response regulator
MSSAIIPTPNELSLSNGVPPLTMRREILLRDGIKALSEIVRCLLTELESLERWSARAEEDFKFDDEVKQFEIALIRAALNRANGSQTRAAQMLGVKITTLNAKIKRYRIKRCG